MDFQLLELIDSATATATTAAAFLVFLWRRRDDDLTVFIFNDDDDDNNDEEKRRYCAVCLNDISGGEKCRKLTECRHCFHVDCVDAWLKNNSTCPLCRTQVSDQIFRRECGRVVSDMFVSWSEIMLDRICNPLNEELSSMVCENVMYAS